MSQAKKLLVKMEAGSDHKSFNTEAGWRKALPNPTNPDDLKIDSVFGRLVAKLNGENIGSFDTSSNTGKIHNDHVKKSLLDGVKDSEEAGEKSADALFDKL